MALFLAFVLPSLGQTGSITESPSNARKILVPDGTRIELRFAQAVVGRGSYARRDAQDSETAQADPGDKVRLVAAGDVRVGGVVIVAKGSIAQATVTAVKSTLRSFSSGIGLRLDWVQDTNENRLPLRATEDGKTENVMLVVRRTSTGVVAQPEGKGKSRVLTGEFRSAGKDSIPVGARMLGYIQGSVSFDADQAPKTLDLTAPAEVTIYQMKDKANAQLSVECDGRLVGRVGPRQFLTLNLAAGGHRCALPDHPGLELVAEPGSEYFLRIVPADGILKNVSVGEGEDSIAGFEVATVP
jgi:hypothetical protein